MEADSSKAFWPRRAEPRGCRLSRDEIQGPLTFSCQRVRGSVPAPSSQTRLLAAAAGEAAGAREKQRWEKPSAAAAGELPVPWTEAGAGQAMAALLGTACTDGAGNQSTY